METGCTLCSQIHLQLLKPQVEKKAITHVFNTGFFSFILCLCIPTKKTKQKNVDEQALRTRKECSVSITQQKHKMEEIQFCSKVWEKHLEESWWVRDRESDAEGG